MKIKKTARAAAAVLTALMIGGCSVKVGTNSAIKDDRIVAESTAENIDKVEITYLDFKKEYLYFLKGQGITDDSEESVAATCKSQRETIINYLINEKVILEKAKELGVDKLTDEEMDAVEEEYNQMVLRQVAYFAGLTNIDPTTTPLTDEQTETGNKGFDEYLASCELTRDDLLVWQVSAEITDKLRAETVKDVSADYGEAESTFNDYVESIKALYEGNQLEYENGVYSAYWIPDGSRRIKHILLGFEDTFTDEIREMRRNGDDEGADKLREEKAAELDEDTKKIINMLDNGADFDELIEEYSADKDGSEANPDGYLLVPNSQLYMEEFSEMGQSLENIGDYDTTLTDYGVHIVLYADDARVTEESIKNYKDYIYELLDSDKKSSHFNDTLKEWREEYKFEIDYDALKIDEPAAAQTIESN
ncbi:MAG: peptidylprolyl isomerase [Oscillospiraceae bacterium]|nr:peptidylprolyl isomerase [Oscillospiraceae bacterium]